MRTNEALPPAPVADVLSPGEPVPDAAEWRVVTATGTYAVDDTVIVRYRTREGRSGVDVVVPLVTPDGTVAARRPRVAGHRGVRHRVAGRRPAAADGRGDGHRVGPRRRQG